MLSLYDIADRIENGPSCSEKQFDLEILYPKVTELVKEYKIKYDPKQVVPSDDEMADNLFKAGLELATEVGLFCIDTERRIIVSRKEILRTLELTPEKIEVGIGKDARPVQKRGISSKVRPYTQIGPTGGPVTEEYYVPVIMSYIVDGMPDAINTAGIYGGVSGQIPKTNSPIEALIARVEGMWLKEAALRRGRPGMQLLGNGQASIATKIGYFATTSPKYNRPSDGVGTAIMNELKVDYDRLSKVFHNADYGCWNRNLVDPIIGGIAGGPEGTTISCVAALMLGAAVNHGDIHTINPIHRKVLSTSSRMCLWLASMTGQAFARNAPETKITGAHFHSAGPGEKMLLEEVAAVSIATVTSGLNVGSGPCPAQCKIPNHFSGIEGIFACETGYATARVALSRSEANDLVLELLDRYEKQQADPPTGKPFNEVYDVKTITPKPAWAKVYEDMTSELEKKGLDFNR